MNLLSTTVTVLRYTGAVLFFTIASFVLGLVAIVSTLGFADIAGAEFFLIWGTVIAAAVWLGVLLLPTDRARRTPAAGGARIGPSAESGEDLIAAHLRDELNERLERQLAWPTRMPPHEYRVRPPIPPTRLERDGDHV